MPSTMYRFKIQLSDVDRGLYREVEMRLAAHPSESMPFFLTRIIAYLLNFGEGVQFSSGGVSSPEEPTVSVRDLTGINLIWMEIGNPSARRLHKASKAAKKVLVYTYRDPMILIQEVAGESVYRVEEIGVFSLDPKFIKQLAETLERDNAWEFLHDDGEISINVRGKTVSGELKHHQLSNSK